MSSDATDPRQYNLPRTQWSLRGAEDAPSRKDLRKALDAFVSADMLRGKDVIDMGSGTGHLFNWLQTRGTASVTGFDPSEVNVRISREKYPWAASYVATLQEFAKTSEEKFDTAFAVMVLEHIENLDDAFQQVKSLLRDNGMLILVIGDNENELLSEKGEGRHIVRADIVRHLPDGAIEVVVERRLREGVSSVIYDILRPLALIRDSATVAGFTLVSEQPVLDQSPAPMYHMLSFKK